MRATKLAFEKRYADDSGVEVGVRLENDQVEVDGISIATFGIADLDFVITALQRIKQEVEGAQTP